MENITCFGSGTGYHEISSCIGLIIQAQAGQLERPCCIYLIKLSRKLLNFTLGKDAEWQKRQCLRLSFGRKHSKLLKAHLDKYWVFLLVISHLIN